MCNFCVRSRFLDVIYGVRLPNGSPGFTDKTCTYLFMLQIRPTGNSYFWFQKRWRMTIRNYWSEISKREKQKFDHFYLKSSWGTQGVAENLTVCANFMTLELYYNTELGAVIDRNKVTRCIAICIAIRVFHITICFLAHRCTPNKLCRAFTAT